MPTVFRLCDILYQLLGTRYKLRSSALSPVRRFNHVPQHFTHLRTGLLSRVLLKARSGSVAGEL